MTLGITASCGGCWACWIIVALYWPLAATRLLAVALDCGSMPASLSPKSFYLLNSVHVEHVCTNEATDERTDGRTLFESLRHLVHVWKKLRLSRNSSSGSQVLNKAKSAAADGGWWRKRAADIWQRPEQQQHMLACQWILKPRSRQML